MATSTSTPEWKGDPVIPYIQGVLEHLRHILTPLKIIKPLITIRQILCRPKDCVPDLQCSGVVYEIKCSHCPKVCIGQTGRRLSQCLAAHNRAVISADFNSSPLVEHAWSVSHPIA